MKNILNKILNKTKQLIKDPIFWARFLGYAIPLAFLLYVLYINYLPFGYHKTFTINVGAPNDTKVGEFYLEPSPDLSDRKTDISGKPFRELNGMATAVFKPNVVLKNAKITVSVEGDGVSLIPPYLDFDPNSVQWDKSWDFTKGVPKDLKNDNNKAFYFDGATYFDGTARLELASSSNMFESGPFTVYAEWMPINDASSSQQIVGHYNWELWQNSNSVYFQVGRMNNATGTMYSIKYPIDKTFFNQKHSMIAVYSPANTNGYIELFVDGKYAGKTYLGPDKIYNNYGKNNLSVGWTPHNYNKSPLFKGNIYIIDIASKNIIQNKSIINLTVDSSRVLNILVTSEKITTLNRFKIDAIKE
jgi:hypothetical protein